jgi:hypothetical protein
LHKNKAPKGITVVKVEDIFDLKNKKSIIKSTVFF